MLVDDNTLAIEGSLGGDAPTAGKLSTKIVRDPSGACKVIP